MVYGISLLMRRCKIFELSGFCTRCIFIFGSIYGAYPWGKIDFTAELQESISNVDNPPVLYLTRRHSHSVTVASQLLKVSDCVFNRKKDMSLNLLVCLVNMAPHHEAEADAKPCLSCMMADN